ncbi:uncharacterized protein LOC110036034 [Phalaenopsis equestris]|uniref:uncharacterized protein LOC110036034 n=1 Tax=Phalaenopsis equestris TaxID=78828 RepID=UPI0009E5CF2C|nr:uncharacterized protein LOC110036034 [Phalaenopsis equestris]
MAAQGGLPEWLRALMEEAFFVDCVTHESKKNIFCLYCCISICENCVPDHRSHHHIQVRRRYGSALVKLDDLKELIDCSLVRKYAANKEKIMFVRPQTQVNVSNVKHNNCSFCGNVLNYSFRYCSLSCKVEYVQWKENGISSILFQFDPSQFVLVESESLQTDVYDKPDDEACVADHNQITPDLAPIDFVQEKGSSSGWSISEIVESCKKKQ